ncbi:MAG: ATP-binding cassette domain-containing protein [Actinomycetota bacterium]
MSGLVVSDLVVEYVTDGYAVRPLDGLSFEASPGRLVVLLGPSGSGKTTLLSCLGGILTPTSGSIRLGDLEVAQLSGAALESYRRDRVGFVFQAFNLIPSLNARENVAIPLMLTGRSKSDALARADELLGRVGLEERLHHRPSQLSGGQQQRVAVARGLGNDPQLLLADEPTANLDHIQAEAVIRLLQELRDQGCVIVVSTHDDRLVPVADEIVQMVPEVAPVEVAPHEVKVSAGETVFVQGDDSDLVYVIRGGEVDIQRELAGGGHVLLRRLGSGQYFGELGPLLGFPRSATAVAATDLVLTAYNPRDFREQVQAKR